MGWQTEVGFGYDGRMRKESLVTKSAVERGKGFGCTEAGLILVYAVIYLVNKLDSQLIPSLFIGALNNFKDAITTAIQHGELFK